MKRFVKEYALYCKSLVKDSPYKKELMAKIDEIMNIEDAFCKEFQIVKMLTELIEQEAAL